MAASKGSTLILISVLEDNNESKNITRCFE